MGLNYLSLDIKTRACVRVRWPKRCRNTERLPPASGHQKIRPEVKLEKILVMQAYLGASQLASLCWLARTVSLTLSTQRPGNFNRLTLCVEFNFQKSAKTSLFSRQENHIPETLRRREKLLCDRNKDVMSIKKIKIKMSDTLFGTWLW